MENNHNGVLLKAHIKRMYEQLDMVYKKRMREEWQVYENNIELKKIIGRGSFCNVHKGAYHNGEESIDVAVKVFEWGEETKETCRIASARKAFLQEVSIWFKLEHPNIAKMIGAIYNKAGEAGEIERLENNGLVVMEYIPRGTLKSYLIEHAMTKLPFNVVMQFALGLARGLSYLHSKKIVHRDVKPDNILLDEELNVKLTNFKDACFEPAPDQNEDSKIENDFHLCALDVENTDFGIYSVNFASSQCKLSGCTGTIGYMAPEVYKEVSYDHKCDVYSFGICLWEIYSCDEPLSHQNSIINYETARPRIPRCCPKSLGKVMAKCWEEPNRRPEMKEIVRLLEEIDVSKCRRMIQNESVDYPSWPS